MTFARKKFVSSKEQARINNSVWGKYLQRVQKNSFVWVGLPFFAIMLMGTHLLTQFNSARYEQHDRRSSELEEEKMLAMSNRRRKIDIKDEFYRLQQLDIDNWEQKRVKRLPGESDNKF